jgi:ribulose-5-phosphate 4-epimerase/fuculose-1-phosphate aldolase
VTASSLVKVDVKGNPVEPTAFITNPAGFTIHSAIHMAREDAHAVMHLHTPSGQAVSAHSDGLLPLTQTALLTCPSSSMCSGPALKLISKTGFVIHSFRSR